MRKFLHALAHLFGMNGCRSITLLHDDDRVIVGHTCLGCGVRHPAYVRELKSGVRRNPTEEEETALLTAESLIL